MRNILGRIAALPTAAKVLLGLAALIALGLMVVLSPLLLVLAALMLIVAVIALLIQLLRRASLRRWGIVAAASLVLVLLFSGISNALYFRGAQEQATSPEPTQEAEPAPEETTTAAEPTAPSENAGGAAGEQGEDDDRTRYDAVVTVTEVVDGDTIEIEPAVDGNEEVRLIGVDTPETKDPDEEVEPYGEEASNYALTELEGEKVELEFGAEREDQYGRLLAYVYPVDEEMFNEDLLKGGYAQVYTVSPNDEYEARFEEIQEEARADKLGIWGLSQSEQCKLADRGNGIGEGTPGCEPRQQRAQEPQPAPAPVTPRDRDCSDFDSQAEAQEVLDDDPSDPNGLDADDDGQACETSSFGESSASPSASPGASASASPNASAGADGGRGGGNRGGGAYAPAPVPAGGDLDCSDFGTQAEAQQVYDADPSDPNDLDSSPEDGVACESLP